MKPSYVLLVAALLTGVGWDAAAQTPDPKANDKPAAVPMVLLLDDFQIVTGTVEKVGETFRVRQGQAVTDYPARRVLFAGQSREEVYRQMLARGVKPPAAAPAPADVNSLAARAFPTKVQPILMNLCADCHAREQHPGAFKLARVEAGYANPESSQRNTRAVVQFLDRADPSASPLLLRAVTAHGDQRRPALRDRSHPAFRNLELWVHWAAGPEGSPMPTAVPAKKPAPMLARQPVVPAVHTEPASPRGDDPYDPSVFNRAMHPGK